MNYKFDYFGDIDNTFVNALAKVIREIPNDAEKLTVNLSSPGGGVASAVTAYNILKNAHVPIHTHNMGEVSSAAILVFLGGSVRTMERVSKFMFHPFAIAANGSLSFASVHEKIRILESDLNNYASIVETEAPAFCQQHRIMDILQHQTVIVQSVEDCLRMGIITQAPEEHNETTEQVEEEEPNHEVLQA